MGRMNLFNEIWIAPMEHKTEMGIVVAAFAALVIYLCVAARKKKKAEH